ncbi:lipopolysaccharide assembly protein LapA domain-containing protein [Xanthobacter pseudotagetidis]|uniref:lipopolysaccharide assembly protein LapA domain-containing protein n=1 Tax=Xanthobacter pseudotagetidis TaxID=3119911 RepID=UPI00372C9E66
MSVGRVLSLLIVVPLSILGVALAVANRKPVTVSLDPFTPATPAFSVTVPLFAVIFAALIAGVVLGGLVTWVSQGRFRREARLARREMRREDRRAEDRRAEERRDAGARSMSLPAPRG